MEQPRSDLVPNPAVRRLSLYLRQLEAFKQNIKKVNMKYAKSKNLTDRPRYPIAARA